MIELCLQASDEQGRFLVSRQSAGARRLYIYIARSGVLPGFDAGLFVLQQRRRI
jgi:hypothetical protein